MASYTSEFSYPNAVQYYTLHSGDYDMTDIYGGLRPSSQAEFKYFYPGPVSSPSEADVYQNSTTPDEYIPWLGIESYFDCYGEEDQFPFGSAFGTFSNAYGCELVEKQEEAYLGEEHSGGNYYINEDNVEMQPAGRDYISWCGEEYGADEDFHDYGTGVDNGYSYSWDEKKLCDSIFGYFPCYS